MNRKLKVLSVALAAVFVMSAVSASSALATKDFRSENDVAVTLTGSQDETDIFTTDAGQVKCSHATYHGTATSPTTTVTVTPTYTSCTALATLVTATIAVNSCDYLFHITGETANGTATGTVDIVCNPNDHIVITAESAGTTKCTITVPPQTGLGPVEFTNVNPGGGTTREVTVDVNIATGITYSQTAGTGGGSCATASNTSNGKYTGKALVTGETDGGTTHVGIFIE